MKELKDYDIEKDFKIRYGLIDYLEGTYPIDYDNFWSHFLRARRSYVYLYLDLYTKDNEFFIFIQMFRNGIVKSRHLFHWGDTKDYYMSICYSKLANYKRFNLFMNAVIKDGSYADKYMFR